MNNLISISISGVMSVALLLVPFVCSYVAQTSDPRYSNLRNHRLEYLCSDQGGEPFPLSMPGLVEALYASCAPNGLEPS